MTHAIDFFWNMHQWACCLVSQNICIFGSGRYCQTAVQGAHPSLRPPAMCANPHFCSYLPALLPRVNYLWVMDMNHHLIVLIFITLIIYKIEHHFYREIRLFSSLKYVFLLCPFCYCPLCWFIETCVHKHTYNPNVYVS